MSEETNASEMPMPARADEPLRPMTYYNLLPVVQPDPAHPLGVVVKDDRFDDGMPLIFGRDLDDGSAQFRLEGGRGRGYHLRSRNSGKAVYAFSGKFVQWTRLFEESFEANLELVPAGKHRYRICLSMNPALQARVDEQALPSPGVALAYDDAPGILFYFVPATHFRWLDSGETAARPYQDGSDFALRALADFAGNKLVEFADVPGGSMIFGLVLSLIWPEKSLDEILQEFRKDLIEDMRRLQATEAMVMATNKLVDTRRTYAMQYRDTKRMNIDRKDQLGALKTSAETYAKDFGAAILGLLPGLIQADGTIPTPIAPEYRSLIRAGLGVYVQGAIDHLTALQERALLDVFDPKFVIRTYPRGAFGRYLEAGTDDRVRAASDKRDREKAISLVNIADGTIGNGDQIALQVSNGNYLSAFFGGKGPLTAIRKSLGEWETFRVERVAGDGKLHSGDKIALLGSEGDYLTVVEGVQLMVNSSTRGAAETFVIQKSGGAQSDIRAGDKVGLLSANGAYISAIDGGGQEVLAQGGALAAWEVLTIARVTVGTTLRYGNQVVLRRPSDGRFASVMPPKDGKRELSMEQGRVTRNSVFTVEGGAVGTAVPSNETFLLRTSDGLYAGLVADGEMIADDTRRPLVAEIVRGEAKAMESVGEPSDWIAAHAKSYNTNIQAMLMFLLQSRYDQITWQRKEVQRVGYSVEMKDGAVNRTLFATLERSKEEFKETEATIEEVRRQYQNHLALNEVMVRYRPLFTTNQFPQAGDATAAMCNRLRRNLEVSSEFWRKAVLPDRAEWKL